MTDYFVASVADSDGGSVAALVVGDRLHALPGRPTVATLLEHWDAALDEIVALLEAVEQESSTSEMMFSVAEQIAYISAIVPLVAGDVICTGTCAGVGMGSGRFLQPGDVMVAEIERIGRLTSPVVADGAAA
jgi:2-keto-4-pentenoate hydratase/2-oxohepta-3-ene-1,7-dioic acid hydratase in catechol pathway